jgi:hypothetical protein
MGSQQHIFPEWRKQDGYINNDNKGVKNTVPELNKTGQDLVSVF